MNLHVPTIPFNNGRVLLCPTPTHWSNLEQITDIIKAFLKNYILVNDCYQE